MLFLRAFPLSFAILWRFTIVLPFFLIFAGVYVTFTFFWGAIAWGILGWFFALLMILVMTFVMGMFPIMIGARLGLQVRKEKVYTTYGSLFMPSLGYGAIETMAKVLIVFGGIFSFIFLSPDLTFEDLSALDDIAAETTLANTDDLAAQFGNVFAFLIVTTGGGLLFAIIRAALLPAFAGAAAGRDPHGPAHTPFSGSGNSFFSLFFLLIVSYILGALALPLTAVFGAYIGAGDHLVDAVSETTGALPSLDTGTSWTWREVATVSFFLLYSLWLFSLQCAGSALSFTKRREVYEQLLADQPPADRMDPDELRDMVRSRMPTAKY